MTKPDWTSRWTKLAAVGLLGISVIAGSPTGVYANDDEEDVPLDTKIIRNFLTGLGLRRDGEGIDYRERSPLVVPPSRDLPQPQTGSVTEKIAAWPNDPDVKRAKEAKARRKERAKPIEEESRPELPGQLGPKAKSTPAGQVPRAGESAKDTTAPSPWYELNPTAKSIFSLGGLVGSKEEYSTFTGEPQRSSLTEPPVGYRTPSPAQPYGVGKEQNAPAAANPMDHGTSNTGYPR